MFSAGAQCGVTPSFCPVDLILEPGNDFVVEPNGDAGLAWGNSPDRASELYRRVQRARGREIDLAIAAHAITQDATLWTLNEKDFEDIPGLVLVPQGR